MKLVDSWVWGQTPGDENGNPVQYSALEPTDRGAWWICKRVEHKLETKTTTQENQK